MQPNKIIQSEVVRKIWTFLNLYCIFNLSCKIQFRSYETQEFQDYRLALSYRIVAMIFMLAEMQKYD